MSSAEEDMVISDIAKLCQERPNFKQHIKFKGWKNHAYFKELVSASRLMNHCFCGDLSAAISIDGYFVPCSVLSTKPNLPVLMKRYNVPNLLYDNLLDSFQSSILFQDFRNSIGFLSGKCLSCSFRRLCGHGCRGYALIQSGDIFAHDPTCNIDDVYTSPADVGEIDMLVANDA